MKIFILLTVISLSLSLTIHNDSPDKDTRVGGYHKLNPTNLSDDALEIDQYLRKLHKFQNVTLIDAQRQVVAGFNYHYVYQSKDKTEQWDIVVYKDLQGNLQENGYTYTKYLPNGQKVTAIADPASAFTGRKVGLKASQPTKKVGAEVSSIKKERKIDLKTFPNTIQPEEAN